MDMTCMIKPVRDNLLGSQQTRKSIKYICDVARMNILLKEKKRLNHKAINTGDMGS